MRSGSSWPWETPPALGAQLRDAVVLGAVPASSALDAPRSIVARWDAAASDEGVRGGVVPGDGLQAVTAGGGFARGRVDAVVHGSPARLRRCGG